MVLPISTKVPSCMYGSSIYRVLYKALQRMLPDKNQPFLLLQSVSTTNQQQAAPWKLKNQIFVDVFLIEDYEYAALRKGLFIAPFAKRFNTTTLGNPYLKVLSVVEFGNLPKLKQNPSAKWLNVRLPTKWLWVRIPLLSFKSQISRLFRARRSLTFRKPQSVDSFQITYVT